MKKMYQKIKNLISGGAIMMINYYAMQVNLGWITLERVPKKYREKVRILVELSDVGTEDEPQNKEE